MRLSRTLVGSDDLSVSAAEAALNRDQFHLDSSVVGLETQGHIRRILLMMTAWRTWETGGGERCGTLC